MSEDKKKGRVFQDSEEYLAKKAAFAKLTTIYGRQAVREAVLNHPHPKIVNLLLAEELAPEMANELLRIAAQKKIPVKRMPKVKLSRITRHQDEDQGMAADLDIQLVQPLQPWLEEAPKGTHLLAVIGVTTPSNIGIIARSVAGAGIGGLIIPEAGCPEPTLPLVIKSSAGHIFRTRIYGVPDGETLVKQAQQAGWPLYALAASAASETLFEHRPPDRAIYLLGNESQGLPRPILKAADDIISIPLAEGVDSLNVAAAATLVAFHLAHA